MQRITLAVDGVDGVVFDLGALRARLEQLSDTRKARGKIYPLSLVLTWVILAKLAGLRPRLP